MFGMGVSWDVVGEAWEVEATGAGVLSPVMTAIGSQIDVLLPVGLSLLAIIIGVSLIPRIVYKFF